MLTMAVSITSVSIMEKKNASSTEFSTQAYATADSGVQLAIRKINGAIGSNKTIGNTFTGCASGKVPTNTDGGPTGSNYELSFLDEDENNLGCGDPVEDIASIKSVGTYKGTVRAVNVAVAAGNLNCRTITSKGMTAADTVIYCNSDEFVLNGGGQCETPDDNFCSNVRSFMHANMPIHDSATNKDGWYLDCFKSDWSGDACGKVWVTCCKKF